MPKESCITHPRGRNFVVIREHLVQMMEGDHAAAALLCYFEYATNSELARMSRAGEDGVAWVRAPMASIFEETVWLYSVRSLQDRMGWLLFVEILKERQCHIGSAKEYTLNIDFFQRLIDNGVRFRKKDYVDSIGNISDEEICVTSEATSEAASAKFPMRGGVLNLKESDFKPQRPCSPIEHSFDKSQNPAKEDSQPLEIGENVQAILVSRLKAIRGVKVDAGAKKAIAAYLDGHTMTGYAAVGFTELFAAEDYWRSYRRPVEAFLKFVQERADGPPPPRTTSRPPAAQPTPESAAPPPIAEPFPPLVLRWNELMPEPLRVRRWNGSAPRAALADAEKDLDFVEDFDRLCARCKELTESGDVVTFVSLFEIPKFAKGKANWYLILNYLFPYKSIKNGGGGAPKKTEGRLAYERAMKMVKAKEN